MLNELRTKKKNEMKVLGKVWTGMENTILLF